MSMRNCSLCTLHRHSCHVVDVVTVRIENIKIIVTVVLFFHMFFSFSMSFSQQIFASSYSTLMYPCPKTVFDLVEESRCNMLKALH
jgi:hypothetical protein